MNFHTYIIYSNNIDSFYIGMTSNLEDRLRKHNGKSKGFTNRAKDWEFVYTKKYDLKSEAWMHEKEIKSWKSKSRIYQFLKETEN